MSKTKNKNRSEIESVRGENRQLKKRLKQLEKQLKIQDNRFLNSSVDEELQLEGFAVYAAAPIKTTCPICKEGEFKMVIDLPEREIYSCTYCHHKKIIKK